MAEPSALMAYYRSLASVELVVCPGAKPQWYRLTGRTLHLSPELYEALVAEYGTDTTEDEGALDG